MYTSRYTHVYTYICTYECICICIKLVNPSEIISHPVEELKTTCPFHLSSGTSYFIGLRTPGPDYLSPPFQAPRYIDKHDV